MLSVRIPKQLKNGAVSAAKRKGKRIGGSRKLSDYEKLMERLRGLGIQPPAGQNAPSVEPTVEPIVEPQPENWRSTTMQGNHIAKKPEPRDAVLSVRIPKQLKNGAVSAAKRKGKRIGGSRKLSDFVIGALESAIEAEKG